MKQFEQYATSKDYDKLYELLEKGFYVICLIEPKAEFKNKRVATFRPETKYVENWELTTQGSCYITFYKKTELKSWFKELCEDIDLEFIDLPQTTKLIQEDDYFCKILVTECCNIGPITTENYCPNCGKKIIRD